MHMPNNTRRRILSFMAEFGMAIDIVGFLFTPAQTVRCHDRISVFSMLCIRGVSTPPWYQQAIAVSLSKTLTETNKETRSFGKHRVSLGSDRKEGQEDLSFTH
jgi:hypothetical protein